MKLSDFDAIRPIAPEELPAAFDELLADAQFRAIMQSFFPDTPFSALKERIYACRDNLEVQKALLYAPAHQLMARCTQGVSLDAQAIPSADRAGSFTFISNHRDIVLDPAFLCVLLLDNGFRTTAEIAIGDNLLVYPWIRTLVRINKSFIVERSLPLRQMLASSKRMSEYMHFAIAEKHENIWIAQREGRAKDSDDRTQESLLKMMGMGGSGSPLERIKQLNLVPLTISYEFDPCDFLKAKEFQQKRDNPDFRKSRQDDLQNMQTGIFGQKGRVHYRMARPVNAWIDSLEELPKTQFFAELARRIDTEIHKGYTIYPSNRVALDLLRGDHGQAGHYSHEEAAAFEQYLQERLALIDLPHKDTDFLRHCLLTMYANPLINHLAACDNQPQATRP